MRRLNTKGFTLIEVLVMAPVMMVTIVLLTSYLFGQYGQLTQQGALINLQTEGQNITFSMQDDIFFAQAYQNTINDNLSDSHGPSGGWQAGANPATFIISTPALTQNRRSATRQPVYINTFGCSPQETLEQNDPLFNNVIYFASGTNLYKRTLSAPSNMSTCGTSFQKQSCPEAQASATCPADRLMTDRLNTFVLTYFDTNNNAVSDPEVAEKVKIDLQLKDKAFGEDIYAASSITMRKLNQ